MSIYQVFDNARDQITRGAATTAINSLFGESVPTNDAEIRKLINSSANRDKIVGLRALLTRVGEGVDCHTFFPDVVKNVYSKDIEVREMTTSYLIMYSQYEPELTLMIVNSVQKMLGDTSAVIRLQALRLASALRVPTIVPIVVHLINEVTNDVSPLIRAACFQAIGKCYDLDSSLSHELLELITHMLSLPRQLSGNFEVAGWGLATIAHYWPQRIDLIHPFFRIYVPHLADFDEWCQIVVCQMLVRYCRHYLTGPEDGDAQLLVQSVVPLLYSNNTAVVVQAAAVVHYIGTDEKFTEFGVAEHLLALDQSSIVWSSILKFAQARPAHFLAHRSDIILSLSPEDPPAVRRYALKCASAYLGPRTGGAELSRIEFAHLKFSALAWQDDQGSVRAALETISSLVGPKLVNSALRWLMKTATDKNYSPQLISEALMCLRVMVQQHKVGTISATLIKLTDLATSQQILPSAKATIVWLLGIHCAEHPGMATELLRKLLPTVSSEATVVRLQVLQLAAKIFTAFRNDPENFDKRVPALFDYALQLGKYDPDIDIRDRTRLFGALLSESDNSMATLLLQASPPIPTTSALESKGQEQSYVIGSTAAFFGKRFDSFSVLEDWAMENTTSSDRADVPVIETSSSSASPEPASYSNSSREPSKPSTPTLTSAEQLRAKQVKQMSLEEFLNTSGPSKSKRNAEEADENEEEETEEEETESEEEETGESDEADEEANDETAKPSYE